METGMWKDKRMETYKYTVGHNSGSLQLLKLITIIDESNELKTRYHAIWKWD